MDAIFTRPALKYQMDALEPTISRQTIELHYGKHLQAYLDNLNALLDDDDLKQASLEDIIQTADSAPLFNNGAQVWNHIFYFNTFSPNGGGSPKGALLQAIEYCYGSFDEFKAEFERQGLSLFGSGWVWLSKDKDDTLHITQEQNAGNPMRSALTPLLTFDVWEHAYYVDCQNRRAEHLSKLWAIVDWSVVEERYLAL